MVTILSKFSRTPNYENTTITHFPFYQPKFDCTKEFDVCVSFIEKNKIIDYYVSFFTCNYVGARVILTASAMEIPSFSLFL